MNTLIVNDEFGNNIEVAFKTRKSMLIALGQLVRSGKQVVVKQ